MRRPFGPSLSLEALRDPNVGSWSAQLLDSAPNPIFLFRIGCRVGYLIQPLHDLEENLRIFFDLLDERLNVETLLLSFGHGPLRI